MSVYAQVFGVGRLKADLLRLGLTVEGLAVKAPGIRAQECLREIQANATHRPGPERRTGEYVASWGIERRRFPGGSSVIVGTDAPQAMRLERGFYGIDAIGRHYAQPAYPHFMGPMSRAHSKFIHDVEGGVVMATR